MSLENCKLNWRGPYQIGDFVIDDALEVEFNEPGVYIWIEETATGHHLSYVGRAGGSPSLFHRQRQHYANMVGGLYTIPKEYRSEDRDWKPDWSDPDVARVLLNPERFHKLVDDGFTYSKNCYIYLSTLNSLGDAKLIERQLLYDLKPTGTKWGVATPPSSPVLITHSNALWATETVISQANGRVTLA